MSCSVVIERSTASIFSRIPEGVSLNCARMIAVLFALRMSRIEICFGGGGLAISYAVTEIVQTFEFEFTTDGEFFKIGE